MNKQQAPTSQISNSIRPAITIFALLLMTIGFASANPPAPAETMTPPAVTQQLPAAPANQAAQQPTVPASTVTAQIVSPVKVAKPAVKSNKPSPKVAADNNGSSSSKAPGPQAQSTNSNSNDPVEPTCDQPAADLASAQRDAAMSSEDSVHADQVARTDEDWTEDAQAAEEVRHQSARDAIEATYQQSMLDAHC